MSDIELDPKNQKVQSIVKYAGVGIVAIVASGAVIVTGASVAVASAVAIAALFMVNLAVPVAARSIAVWKQKALTQIAETFSEETIREDEAKEADRIAMLEQQYVTSRSNLEGAQDELRKELKSSSPEEVEIINSQIASMQSFVDSAEDALKKRKVDFGELQRVNKLYIALHRSANAMQKAQGANRNSEELQRIVTARDAIKTKMRAAMAGQTISNMNLTVGNRSERVADVLSSGAKR